MKEKEFEKLLKAVANRRRLAILSILSTDPQMSVMDIARHINLSFRSTSRHLRVLTAQDVLEREQVGPVANYRLANNQHPVLKQIIKTLR